MKTWNFQIKNMIDAIIEFIMNNSGIIFFQFPRINVQLFNTNRVFKVFNGCKKKYT